MDRFRDWLRDWLGITQLRASVTALRNAEERHYRDLLAATQAGALGEGQERILALLTPVAPRLRAGRAPVADWQQVQLQQLNEFEDK